MQGLVGRLPLFQISPCLTSKPVKPQHDLLKRTLMISHDSSVSFMASGGIFGIQPFQIRQHAVPLTSNGLRLARQR